MANTSTFAENPVTDDQMIILFGGEEDKIRGNDKALIFDAVTVENSVQSSVISKHPIDSGLETTDNVFNQNRTFNVKVSITDTPISTTSTKNLLTQKTTADEIAIKNAVPKFRQQAGYDTLMNLYKNNSLFTIITTYEIVYNCVLKSLRFPVTSLNHMVADMVIEQLRIVSTTVESSDIIINVVKDDAEKPTAAGNNATSNIEYSALEALYRDLGIDPPPEVQRRIDAAKGI